MSFTKIKTTNNNYKCGVAIALLKGITMNPENKNLEMEEEASAVQEINTL